MKYLKTFESWRDIFRSTKVPMNRVSHDIENLMGGELKEYLLEANDEEIFDHLINNFDEAKNVSKGNQGSFDYKGVGFYVDKFWTDTHSIYYIYGPEKGLEIDEWYKRYIKSEEYFYDLYRLMHKKDNQRDESQDGNWNQ